MNRYSAVMGIRSLLLATLLCSAMTAEASPPGRTFLLTSGDNIRWQGRLNRHGAVLRSATATIYAGRNCDALSPQFGQGRWDWANGGVLFTFPGRKVGFPRQSMDRLA